MIRAIWLERRLDWHHWRAERLSKASRRHFHRYLTLHPTDYATRVFVGQNDAAAA